MSQEIKISVQKALTELKGINKKLENITRIGTTAAIVKKDQLIDGLYSKEAFIKIVESKIQSSTDLFERKKLLKYLINQSNATTEVTINEKTMTVAAAIAKRELLPEEKAFVTLLKKNNTAIKALYQSQLEKVSDAAEALVKTSLEANGAKRDEAVAKGMIDGYISANSPVIICPVSDEEIEASLENLLKFEEEVDTVLSESNALTKITITENK